MRRLFVPGANLQAATLEIGEPDFHHLIRVLRMRVGDPLVVLDNAGSAVHAEISAIQKRSFTARLGSAAEVAPEPSIHITVAQALGKGDKFEQVIAHNTEIGASAFIPLETERAVVRLTPEEAKVKRARWNLVAKGAVEQAGRARIPSITPLQTLSELVCRFDEYARVIVLHPCGVHLACVLDEKKEERGDDSIASPLLLVIGPEGGFSPDEVNSMRKAGAHVVSLGPYILRTETAALVAISQILYHDSLTFQTGEASTMG